MISSVYKIFAETSSGKLLFFFFYLFFVSSQAVAAILRHNILENDSADSVQTQRVCFGIKENPRRILCLPTLFLSEREGRVQLDVDLKANERSYKIVDKIVDKTADKQFIESLFEEDNFQAVSGAARLHAIYYRTAISYIPLHLIGAFKLSNPSLPEIHAVGMKQSVFRLSHNFLFLNCFDWGLFDFLIYASTFYYQRTFAYLDTDILSLSVQKIDKVIEKKKQESGDGDLALTIFSRSVFLPSFSLKFDNLVDKYEPECLDCKERFFDIEKYFYAKSSVKVFYSIPHPIGQSLLGITAPFWGVFKEYDKYDTAFSYVYKLSQLHSIVSFSPLMYSFGFLFASEHYRVGVQYTDEKQDNSIQIERQKQTYVYASLYL